MDTVLSSPDAGVEGSPWREPTAPIAFCVEWQLPSQDEPTTAEGVTPLRLADPRPRRWSPEWAPVDRGGAG
jgi:hypothetical protein